MAIGPIPLAFYILIHEDFILYHSDKISFAPQMAILSYTQLLSNPFSPLVWNAIITKE